MTLLVARYQLLERPVTEIGEAKTTVELESRDGQHELQMPRREIRDALSVDSRAAQSPKDACR